MIGFWDCVRAAGLIREADGDDESVKQLLLMAAAYIREGEPLPADLRDYMAGAIEAAVNTPARLDPYNKDTGTALLIGLKLKRTHRPASGVDPYAVCQFMFDEMLTVTGAPRKIIITACDGTEIDVSPASQSEAARRAADVFNISESTAKRYFRQHMEEYMQSLTAEADPPTEDEIDWLAEMQEQLTRS